VSTLLPLLKSGVFLLFLRSDQNSKKKREGNTVQMESVIFFFSLVKWGNQSGLKGENETTLV